MVSYQEALQSVLDRKIQHLNQLKGKLSNLDRELEGLNSRKEDAELKLRGLERPGRRRKGQVDNWLKVVEGIKEKRQDMMNQINNILTYESTDEVFEELIKDVENYQSEGPSSDGGNILQDVGVKQTIIGMGSIGPTNFNLRNSPTTFHIGPVQIIHNHDRTQGNCANGEGKA